MCLQLFTSMEGLAKVLDGGVADIQLLMSGGHPFPLDPDSDPDDEASYPINLMVALMGRARA